MSSGDRLQKFARLGGNNVAGRLLVFRIFGGLAKSERNLNHECTKADLEAARAKGKKCGRPKVLDEEKSQRLCQLYDDANQDGSRKYTIKEICELISVSRSALYSYLGKRNEIHQQNLTGQH